MKIKHEIRTRKMCDMCLYTNLEQDNLRRHMKSMESAPKPSKMVDEALAELSTKTVETMSTLEYVAISIGDVGEICLKKRLKTKWTKLVVSIKISSLY